MLEMDHKVFLLLIAVLPALLAHGRRHHHHHHQEHSSSEDIEQEIQNHIRSHPCDVLCQAQFKSDFQIKFQKLHDISYFETPLDPVVLSSTTSLNSFCNIIHQKFRCYMKKCGIKRLEWSPDKFICLDHLKDFEENNKCLSKTSPVVRRECTAVCNRVQAALSPAERSYIDNLVLSRSMHADYLSQNQFCHVVSCHHICHDQVISHMCDHQHRKSSRDLVKKYYDSIFLRDWADREDTQREQLYSSYCRRLTPDLDENQYVANMTHFNNGIIHRVKQEVKEMLMNIS